MRRFTPLILLVLGVSACGEFRETSAAPPDDSAGLLARDQDGVPERVDTGASAPHATYIPAYSHIYQGSATRSC